jgi:hypothetical protein
LALMFFADHQPATAEMAHVVHPHWCVRSRPANSCGRLCGYVAMLALHKDRFRRRPGQALAATPASLHAIKAPGFNDVEIHHHAGVARLFRGRGSSPTFTPGR